ncbi:MAG: glycosyltransferase [Actinobacteria bacterium]|nr:glycosyltransferase [Actinomycetota bacterium]
MPQPLMISLVVNNFNYAEFVAEAIESALAQRGAETEVIVVDDGSTDGSRDVIRRYGDRVRTLLKENGGQASAFNSGFRASRGEIVIFLDADDTLLPDTAARITEVFTRRPGTAKVHYPLEMVDQKGRPTGFTIPAPHIQLPEGDLRERVLRSPADVTYPPTSGNAFSANCLKRILPMPESEYRTSADVYLVNLASLLGPVGRLTELGGRYRVHGRNAHFRPGFDLDHVRSTIRTTHATHAHLAELAASLGLREPGSIQLTSVTDVAHRLISCRVEPAAHPIPSDRPARLALRGAAAALRRQDLEPSRRLLYVGWFLAAAVAPRPAVLWLGEQLLRTWRRVGWGVRGTFSQR